MKDFEDLPYFEKIKKRNSFKEYSNKQIYNMCSNKATYSTEAMANRSKSKALQERNTYLRVYLCPICDKYHLTKSGFNT